MLSTGGGGLIVILFFLGMAGGVVGRTKGSSFWMWFLISFCAPVIGLVTAILYRNEAAELRRQCPNCGRILKLEDTVCMRCGCELEFPDVAIAPAASVISRQPRAGV